MYFPEERDEQQAAIVAENLEAVKSYYAYSNFLTFEEPIVDLQAAVTALYWDNPTAHVIRWNSRQMDNIVFAVRTQAGLPVVDPATSSLPQSPPPSGGIIAQVLCSPSTLYHYLTGGPTPGYVQEPPIVVPAVGSTPAASGQLSFRTPDLGQTGTRSTPSGHDSVTVVHVDTSAIVTGQNNVTLCRLFDSPARTPGVPVSQGLDRAVAAACLAGTQRGGVEAPDAGGCPHLDNSFTVDPSTISVDPEGDNIGAVSVWADARTRRRSSLMADPDGEHPDRLVAFPPVALFRRCPP